MKKEIWNYIKNHKNIYIIVVIALVVEYLMILVPTMTVQFIIDHLTNQTLTIVNLSLSILGLLISTVILYIASMTWVKKLYKQKTNFCYHKRVTLFNKIVNMRAPYYEKFSSGDMMTRFVNDVNDFSELLGYGTMCLLFSVCTFIVIIPAMLILSWEITILSSLPIIICAIIVHYLGKYQEHAIEESRDAVSKLSDEVLEVIEGIRVTRAYGKKELGAKKFKEKTALLAQKANNIMLFQASFGRIATIGLGICTAIVIGLGGIFMEQGRISLGQVIALQLYTLMLMEPMWVLTDLILVYQAGKVSYSKLTELLVETDDMEQNGQIQLDIPITMEMKNYSFSYRNSQKNELENIHFTLHKGQTLGVVGKTGSGKTTFVRQWLRQYPVGTGEFLINGIPIQQFDRQSLTAKIGYVPQEHILFSKTVAENIAFGKQDAQPMNITEAIHIASFTDDIKRMSNGLETLVGEKGVAISGGQKQRISIARAFIKDPDILILDDSLSAVDAKTERKIIDNIQTICQNKTNIIVTHRLSAVNHADWILVLESGQIIESGTPKQLLEQKGWYFEQYEKQQLEVNDK